ncbi:MAG: zinc ribbon domain-containing protein, partial [Lachnospiraceae bacterium]|nr:zinc ribbon domain-containing protein [Lachnospiraceae bacterium]MCR5008442.1 zinc ribbon domain-containing protein [Oribacterium sp.]
MFCVNCGNKIPDEANVCPHCGTVLRNTGADNQEAPAQ